MNILSENNQKEYPKSLTELYVSEISTLCISKH